MSLYVYYGSLFGFDGIGEYFLCFFEKPVMVVHACGVVSDDQLSDVCFSCYFRCLSGGGVHGVRCFLCQFFRVGRFVVECINAVDDREYLLCVHCIGAVGIVVEVAVFVLPTVVFGEEEAAAWHGMFEGYGSDGNGAVFVYHFLFARVDFVEDHFKVQVGAVVVQQGLQQSLQVGMCVYMQGLLP